MFFPLAPQSRGSYFHFMKNTLWLPVFLIVFFGVLAAVPLRGATPAEIAAQQEAEDRYKSLNATIEELKETLVAKEKRLAALEAEIRSLREETARAGQHAVNPEAIKQLTEKIQEVDKKREADNRLTQETLANLQKGIRASLAPSPRSTPKTNAVAKTEPALTAPNGPEKLIEYKVKEGDRLSLILKDVRDQGYKITEKQIREANPTVDWNRLMVGKKIYIPLPEQAKAAK